MNRRAFIALSALTLVPTGSGANSGLLNLFANASGNTIYIPAGDYHIDKPIGVMLKKSMSVQCHPDAKFIASTGFPEGKKLFHFNSGSNTGIRFEWHGGQFHGQNMPPRTSGAPDLFALIGWGIDRAVISGAEFFRLQKDSRGGTALFIAAVNSFEVSGCKFHGSGDAGIYVSGNQAQSHGERGLITGCHFFDVSVGVIAKRNFNSIMVNNSHFRNSGHGVVLGGEADNDKLPGKMSIVSDNTFSGVIKSIEFRNTAYGIAHSNIIEGVGVHGSSGRVVGNAGISVRGSSHCQVYGNTLTSVGGQHINSRAFQFLDVDSDNPDSYKHAISHNNHIYNNMIVDMRTIVNWSNGKDNRFEH